MVYLREKRKLKKHVLSQKSFFGMKSFDFARESFNFVRESLDFDRESFDFDRESKILTGKVRF